MSNDEKPMVLITGAAGFIGYHLAERLLMEGFPVAAIDNLNNYYDVELKKARLRLLRRHPSFAFTEGDIAEADLLFTIFATKKPRIVVNLAAQAGVRYSLENPSAYVKSNLVGFANVLEACRRHKVDHLLYASSSSVYGGNTKVPFEEDDPVDHPVSLYAATKKSNELMADCYSHLYGIPSSGLRFFTVYGPYGRPDMAYYQFADRYFANQPIKVFNNGDEAADLYRDFTYIDDVIESVIRLLPLAPRSSLPHKIFNVGGGHPEKLATFIAVLEESFSNSLGHPILFDKIFERQKPGDVPRTYANSDRLYKATGFRPRTSLRDGLQRFADWYVEQKVSLDDRSL